MATYKSFEELPVWSAATDLAVAVFKLTESPSFRYKGDLVNQLRRAALSVPNNVAEGFERGTTAELISFLYISRGSAGEVRSMLRFALRLGEMPEETSRMEELVVAELQAAYDAKKAALPEELFQQIENQVMLRVIDTRWMAHLSEMDYLRTGIGLRAIGQRDPLVEYKEEAFNAFGALVAGIYEDFLRTVMRLHVNIEVAPPEEVAEEFEFEDEAEDEEMLEDVSYSAPDEAPPTDLSGASNPQARAAADAAGEALKPSQGKVQQVVKDKSDPFANVGRNDPCPCGSGKKFKKCHGAKR